MILSIGSMVKHISKCPFLKRSEDLNRTWEDHINSRSNRLKTGVWIYYCAAAWLCVCVFHLLSSKQVCRCLTAVHSVTCSRHRTHTLKTSNIGVFLHLLALVSQGFIIIETNRFQVFSLLYEGHMKNVLETFHQAFIVYFCCFPNAWPGT